MDQHHGDTVPGFGPLSSKVIVGFSGASTVFFSWLLAFAAHLRSRDFSGFQGYQQELRPGGVFGAICTVRAGGKRWTFRRSCGRAQLIVLLGGLVCRAHNGRGRETGVAFPPRITLIPVTGLGGLRQEAGVQLHGPREQVGHEGACAVSPVIRAWIEIVRSGSPRLQASTICSAAFCTATDVTGRELSSTNQLYSRSCRPLKSVFHRRTGAHQAGATVVTTILSAASSARIPSDKPVSANLLAE